MIHKAPGLVAAAVICLASTAAVAQKPPALVKEFNDWALYKYQGTGTQVCFSASRPKTRKPVSAQSDKTYFYISAWPKEGVKAEISIKMGYTLKKNSIVEAKVDARAFRLFTDKDNAFVADLGDELKLIEAIKRGRRMVVSGTSESGEKTEDVYSLSGTTAALNAMAQTCK